MIETWQTSAITNMLQSLRGHQSYDMDTWSCYGQHDDYCWLQLHVGICYYNSALIGRVAVNIDKLSSL